MTSYFVYATCHETDNPEPDVIWAIVNANGYRAAFRILAEKIAAYVNKLTGDQSCTAQDIIDCNDFDDEGSHPWGGYFFTPNNDDCWAEIVLPLN